MSSRAAAARMSSSSGSLSAGAVSQSVSVFSCSRYDIVFVV